MVHSGCFGPLKGLKWAKRIGRLAHPRDPTRVHLSSFAKEKQQHCMADTGGGFLACVLACAHKVAITA